MNHHIRRFWHGRIQSGYGRVRWKIQQFSDLQVEDGENLAGFFGRTTRYCLTIFRHPSRWSIQREGARRRKILEFFGATVGDMLYGYTHSMSLIRITRVTHSW